MANKYWVGGTGTWSQTTHWSLTSGGASGAAVPTASDDVIFDGNSGTGSYTVTVAATPTAPLSITINNTTNSNSDGNISISTGVILGVQASATLTRFTQSSTQGTFTVSGLGRLDLNCGVTISNPSIFSCTVTSLYNSGALSQWNFNNCSMSSNIIINTNGMTLTGNLTTTGSFTHTNNGAGPVTITGYTLSVGSAIIGGTSLAATYNFGSTGVFNITGTSGTVLQVNNAYTPTGSNAYLNITGGGSTARSIAMGTGAGASVNVTSGTFSLTFSTIAGLIDSLNFTGFSGTWAGDTTAYSIAGTLTLSSTMTMGTGTGAISFVPPAATTRTHQLNGLTFNRPMTINGADATAVTIFDTSVAATSVAGALIIAGGTLDITNKTFTAHTLAYTTSVAKLTAFGTTGSFYLTAPGGAIFSNNAATSFTYTGTSNVTVNTAGSGTKTIDSSAATLATAYNFYFTGGTYTMSVTAASVFNNFVTTGSSPTISNTNFSVGGNFTISSTTTFTGATATLTFIATSSKTITTNAVSINRVLTFNGVAGTWQLQDALTTSALTTLTNGTLDLNGKMLTTASFNTAAGTKNLTFNGGSITATGATCFNNAAPTNFTTTAGTAKGFMYASYAAGAKTFVGGGSTYAATLVQTTNATGALTISGNNTLSSIKNTTQPTSIIFTSGSNNTFTDDFKLKGTGGALVTITATTNGVGATVTKLIASGNVNCDYISVKDNLPAGTAFWYAGAHSTLVSNYTGVNGWNGRPPPSANTEFLVFLQ